MKSRASGSAGRERWVVNVFKRLTAAILFSFFLLLAPSGDAQEASGELKIPSEAVSKKILDNGLIVLVVSSPVTDLVSINLAIKSGSAGEGERLGSGTAHFTEHMVFRGTPTRKAGDIEKEVKSYGGTMNGGVMQDFTVYYITLPARYLDKAVAMLKDMVQNASFDQKEFDKEREIILNEINMDNDDPDRVLIKRLNETAYTTHPYRYPCMGYPDKFKALSREDLVSYYRDTYVPNKMILTIAGGIDPDMAIAAVESQFKNIGAPDYAVRDLAPAEPLQIARRDYQEEAQVSLAYMAMGFHSTRLASEDLCAMDVLSMILGRGDNSRLNRSLVKGKLLAHTVSAWNYTPKEPGLFVITAITDRDDLKDAQAAVLEEIERIKNAPVSDVELETARRMALSDLIFERQTIDGLSSDIGKSEAMTGSRDFSERYVAKIRAVTRDDIKTVASRYLTEDNLTLVELVPSGTKDAAPPSAGASSRSETMIRELLANGLKVIVRPDRRSPIVSISAAMLAGLSAERPESNGVSNITSRMLLKGTKTRSEADIKGAVDRLGGNISNFSGYNSIGINLVVLKQDLDFALELLYDILNNPVFPEEELEKEKALVLAEIKEEDDDIFQRAANELRVMLFKGSQYSMRTIGESGTVSAMSRGDVNAFYNAYCSANNATISVSGDVDPEAVIKKMDERFRNFRTGQAPAVTARKEKNGERAFRDLTMNKDQSVVLIGFETVDNKDPDRFALEVISSILSGSSGRLYHTLRGDMSLAYTLGCFDRQMNDTGYFVVYVATTREKIREAKKAILDEIDAIRAKPVSMEDLELAKRELITGLKVDMQLNQFLSYTSALDELYGLGYNNVYRHEKEIENVTRDDVLRAAQKHLDPGRSAEITILSSK